MPEEKQVNLYQYGLRSVRPVLPHGPTMSRLPQSGTLFCVNVVVPQTGKAVCGFWPGLVQVCAFAKKVYKNKLIHNSKRGIRSSIGCVQIRLNY